MIILKIISNTKSPASHYPAPTEIIKSTGLLCLKPEGGLLGFADLIVPGLP